MFQSPAPTAPTTTATNGLALLSSQAQRENGAVRYVACHFSRTSPSQTWGLIISLFEDKFLIVDDVVQSRHQRTSNNPLSAKDPIPMRWSWSTAQPPNPAFLWNRSMNNDEWTNLLLERYFAQLPLCPAAAREILPGDCILSMNGIPISSFQGSFVNIIAYLRQARQLLLVVVRHPEAVSRACTWRGQGQVSAAAEAAYQTYQQIYPGGWPGRSASNFNAAVAWLQQASAASHFSSLTNPQQWSSASTSNMVPLLTAPCNSQPSSPTGYLYYQHHAPAVVTPPSTKRMKPSPSHELASLTATATTTAMVSPYRPDAPYLPKAWTNPMFPPDCTYDDNCEFDPYDGSRSHLFLTKIDSSNFSQWLTTRKQTWRSNWKPHPTPASQAFPAGSSQLPSLPTCCVNPMFPCHATGDDRSHKFLPYDDDWEFDPYDGTRSKTFLTTIDSSNFTGWLKNSKRKWAKNWNVYHVEDDTEDHGEDEDANQDFWTSQGFSTFDHWVSASKEKWQKSYSWNRRKRKRIQLACEAVVELPSSADSPEAAAKFSRWLRVRKSQWLMLRRTRQRRMEEENRLDDNDAAVPHYHNSDVHRHIDVLLEEEECKKKALEARAPLDISFIFFPNHGCPDDVVAKIFGYMAVQEHGKMLCISKAYSKGIQQRNLLWQQLCPIHWNLPRRPRQPWHRLYISRLKSEHMAFRKLWDDLMSSIAEVLAKGDQLQVVKKLVKKAEKDFGYYVDFVSGVVLERNSILNIAVINRRHKVAKWLVEKKHADIESSDRGHFTPLINAAWSGDRALVRLMLHAGADRSKVGFGHYSQALAHPDFEGRTAEGWAREKGYDDIAELIRIGIK